MEGHGIAGCRDAAGGIVGHTFNYAVLGTCGLVGAQGRIGTTARGRARRGAVDFMDPVVALVQCNRGILFCSTQPPLLVHFQVVSWGWTSGVSVPISWAVARGSTAAANAARASFGAMVLQGEQEVKEEKTRENVLLTAGFRAPTAMQAVARMVTVWARHLG